MEKPIKQLNLFGHIWASLLRVFIALAFAWLLGISFGILIGWNKKANALLGPLFTAFRSVPPLAWVPLMTMWFGTGEFPKILIVFIGALMPVVVNTQAGISNVQNMYLNVGTIFHANKRQMLFEIAIPSALDAIFAGCENLYLCRLDGGAGCGDAGRKVRHWFPHHRGMDSETMPVSVVHGVYRFGRRAAGHHYPALRKDGLSMDGKKVKLRLEHISQSYIVKNEVSDAVVDVSLDVYDNEFLVILGPGRCGKTVLLNMIAGLEKPVDGSLFLDGEEIHGSDERIGMVFQKLALMPWKTVMENVEFGSR